MWGAQGHALGSRGDDSVTELMLAKVCPAAHNDAVSEYFVAPTPAKRRGLPWWGWTLIAAGAVLVIGFVVLLHLSLQQASANAKVVNFASNLAAMIFLTWKGLVIWKVSIPMALGQFIGGTIGAQLAVKGGDTLMRRVVLFVVLALVTKLGYELLHTA